MEHETSTFLSGFAPLFNRLFFSKEIDRVAQDGSAHSLFFVFDGTRWMQYKKAANWPAISMASVKPNGEPRVLLAIGPEGQFWEVDVGTATESFGLVPDLHYQLRSLSVIDDHIYACGMGRIALRREPGGQWTVFDALGPSKDDTVVGFEDISGFSANDIYTTGWAGEIWWFHDGRWQQIDSPVSGNMNAVCCAADGNVYIAGESGTLVRGREDTWTVLDTGQTLNLMDVCEYEGDIYVATDFSILKLDGDTLVADDNFADETDPPATCLYLLKAPDGLYSMGPKDLFRRQAGPWERLV